MEENQFEGTAKDIGGKVKDGIGGLTGDESLQAEGKADQAAGKAQKLYGSAKETLGNAAEAASEAFTARPHYSSSADSYVDDSMVARATTMVKEQPILALLGTAAAGYALAFLLHGGRSRR